MPERHAKWTHNFKDLFLLCVQELNRIIFTGLLLITEEGKKISLTGGINTETENLILGLYTTDVLKTAQKKKRSDFPDCIAMKKSLFCSRVEKRNTGADSAYFSLRK